uniref:phenylalanine-tRNA ligase beta subunit n=1 Tax=Hypnea cryptica TaxID=2546159 RepID=UPI0027DA52CC|nr:phenylalanine-tRNA ligase beta subunit [Hypnea cryptica]WCH56016.1 phenylalanine-tRNA ligase beta subunit [Hypnea cryptica]
MKFSWQWIKEISNLPNITLEESIIKLTLAGFEIESIDNKKNIDDTTLELSVTTNRSDAASIIGISRELKTIFKSKNILRINTSTKVNLENEQFNTIELKKSKFTNENLSDIKITIIKNIKIQNSPEWLNKRLQACEITQGNTLYNIAKYIRTKWGQDIEIFDTNKIDKQKFTTESIAIRHLNIQKDTNPIIVSDETSNNFIETLTYKNHPISLLGIKSNSKFHCDHNTSSIIIFGYICSPKYINRTTQLFKDKTEKSQKHIKGLSRKDFINAYNETVSLILQLTKYTKKISQYTWHAQNHHVNNILVNTNDIKNILGPINQRKDLKTEEIIDILQQLNFKPKQEQDFIKVHIPEYRKNDIKRPIDITEEIGRIYGFNHFIDTLPQKKYKGYISKMNILIQKVRNILKQLGLYEIIHYSLININNRKHKAYISLYNPLQEDQRYLRKNLLYNLINTLEYNHKRKNAFMECFEINKTFQPKKSINNENQIYYTEKIHIAGVIGKNNFSKRLWSEDGQEISWFQAKGLLETVFDQIHAEIEWTNNFKIAKHYQDIINICHPYKFAILKNKINQRIIGIFGELDVYYSNKINQNHKNYIFELDLREILKNIQIKKHLSYIFTKYSQYPSITRNVCLKLRKSTTSNSVKAILLSHNKKLIESIKIIDEYQINNYKEESRKVSYKIIYRSSNNTLSENEIKEIDKKLNHITKYINTTVSSNI